jgi:hypothetical protein
MRLYVKASRWDGFYVITIFFDVFYFFTRKRGAEIVDDWRERGAVIPMTSMRRRERKRSREKKREREREDREKKKRCVLLSQRREALMRT